MRAVEGTGRCHTSHKAAHMSARVGRMATRLMAAGSRDIKDHSGNAHERVEFPEVDRSSFQKTKSKNLKKGHGSKVGND